MKSKLYKCDKCGFDTSIRSRIKKGEHKGKKVCSNCYNQILRPLSDSKPKKVSYANKQKKMDSGRSNDCLDHFFDYHVNNCNKSDESDVAIQATRVNIAHIFMKRVYKSVMCNLDNVVYLTWQEHFDFDKLLNQHRWNDLEKEFPNSWFETCRRAAKLLPLITERGKFLTIYKEYLKEKDFVQ